jgi:hypothetical protein
VQRPAPRPDDRAALNLAAPSGSTAWRRVDLPFALPKTRLVRRGLHEIELSRKKHGTSLSPYPTVIIIIVGSMVKACPNLEASQHARSTPVGKTTLAMEVTTTIAAPSCSYG